MYPNCNRSKPPLPVITGDSIYHPSLGHLKTRWWCISFWTDLKSLFSPPYQSAIVGRILFLVGAIVLFSFGLKGQTYEVITHTGYPFADSLNRSPYTFSLRSNTENGSSRIMLVDWLLKTSQSRNLQVFEDFERIGTYSESMLVEGLRQEYDLPSDYYYLLTDREMDSLQATETDFETYFHTQFPQGIRVPPVRYHWDLGFIEQWTVLNGKIEVDIQYAFLEARDPKNWFLPWRFVFPYDPADFPWELLTHEVRFGGVEEYDPKQIVEEHYFRYAIGGIKEVGQEQWQGKASWLFPKQGGASEKLSLVDSLAQTWPMEAHFKRLVEQASQKPQQSKGLVRFMVPQSSDHCWGSPKRTPHLFPEDSTAYDANKAFFQQLVAPLTVAVIAKEIKAYRAKAFDFYPATELELDQSPFDHHLLIHAWDNGDDGWGFFDDSFGELTVDHPPKIPGWLASFDKELQNYAMRTQLIGKWILSGDQSWFEPEYILLTWADPGITLPDNDFVVVPLQDLPYTIDGMTAIEFLKAHDLIKVLLQVNDSWIKTLEEAKLYQDIFSSGRWDEFPGGTKESIYRY